MSSITSTGLGSGLDVNSIVTAIVGAEKDPALQKIVTASADATAKISAYGTLNSTLSDFKQSYASLGYDSTFSAADAVSSDASVLDASLGIGAATGSWNFEVKQLAQAQTLVSSADSSYPEATAEIGTGEITFSYGTFDVDETGVSTFSINPDKPLETLIIDPTNNSLDKLRDAINEGDYSVSASIIDDGTNFRLVLNNKETGAENAMQVSVVDDDGIDTDAAGLSSLTYTTEINNMDKTSTAQDAQIVMNGVDIIRSSNDIANVIEGVTLNLGDVTEEGKTVSLRITQDTSGVEEQIRAFIENYNGSINQMNKLTTNGGEEDSNGALMGETSVRSIENQMRSLLNTSMPHLEGTVKSFANLGILTNRDGTIAIDSTLLINNDGTTSSETRFSNALKNNTDSVADFFTASGGATDSFIEFEKNSSLTRPGSYDIEVTKMPTQGVLTGVAYTMPISVSSGNSTFTMRLDGYLSEEIKLTPGTYESVDDFITELQLKINSDSNFVQNGLNVSVVDEGGALSIVSNRYGSRSSVAITEIEANNFGLSVAVGDYGTNVEGLIDGMTAFSDGQSLLSQNGDSTGLKAKITGGDIGSRGTVIYSDGMKRMLDTMLDGAIDRNITSAIGDTENSGSTIDSATDSLYKKIALLETQEANVNYRADKLEARLFTQYNAMDIAVSGMKSTMSYLEATLNGLPGYNNK